MNRTKLSDSELAALVARIQQNYDYDDRSGKLINRQTGNVMRGSKCSQKNGVCRYLQMDFRISGQRHLVLMHQAVWAWHHGRLPTMQIDHINGNSFDNHIENLREVTPSENMRNMVYPWKPNARTGLPGVNKYGNSYRIKVAQKLYHFHDPFEAFYHLTLLGRRFR